MSFSLKKRHDCYKQINLFETMEQWQSKHTFLKHWGCSDCALLLYNRLTSRQGTSDKRQAVSLCFTDCGAKFTSFTGNCLLNWREHLRQTQIRQTFSVSLFDFAGKQTDTSITHSGRLYWQPFMAVANKKGQSFFFFTMILIHLLFPMQLTRDERPWIALNSCHSEGEDAYIR